MFLSREGPPRVIGSPPRECLVVQSCLDVLSERIECLADATPQRAGRLGAPPGHGLDNRWRRQPAAAPSQWSGLGRGDRRDLVQQPDVESLDRVVTQRSVEHLDQLVIRTRLVRLHQHRTLLEPIQQHCLTPHLVAQLPVTANAQLGQDLPPRAVENRLRYPARREPVASGDLDPQLSSDQAVDLRA